MISVFFTGEEVVDFHTAQTTDQNLFKQFFHEMLKKGVYLPPSPFESWFIANSHTEAMLDETVTAADTAIATLLSE